MKRTVLYLFAITLLMASCYPGGAEYYEETDIVYTNYDKAFDFKAAGTYAMPNEIVKVTGAMLGENETPEFLDDRYSVPMLAQIDKNMAKLGWTKVAKEEADVLLFPAVSTSTTVVYYYDYWCWYYPYYCGWGYYNPYPSVSTYTTGTMVMAMIPTMESDTKSSVWTMAINGLMSGGYEVNRVNNAIDQAFEQSPILNTK